MNKRTITNEEFIELWQAHKSAAKVAKLTGISERNVHKRRREIEAKNNIQLHAAYNQRNNVTQSKTNIQLGIQNGCVLIFSDAHFQRGRRTTAFKALLWLIQELKPKAVINNGDAFDGGSLSRFPVSNWDTPPSVLEELQACKMYLGEIEEAAKDAYKPVKLVWCMGNHDSRLNARLASVVPQFKSVDGFTLEENFPEWTHTMSCLVTDSFMVKHRWKGGVHAVSANTQNSGLSFATGHLHSAKVSGWTDYTGTRWGIDTGTLSEIWSPAFSYAEDSPRNWRAGFAVANIAEGRLLQPELVIVSDIGEDLVEFRGELVDVSEF